ncbi:MAG: hypothetical protein PHW62_04710, partial [Candidatus Ratteibacteria bacterium]|nr:hypothetical protein [Candidatus Ratteibacteria bacterium]
MNISRNKKFTTVFLSFLIFSSLVWFNICAQEQQSETENLRQVKILLNEGFEYLKVDAFAQAKIKFEEALKIAPKEMAEEIKGLIVRVDGMSAKREVLTKDVLTNSEEEAKKLSELQQNIIQFEKEQKKQAYLSQGKLYFDKGEYEQALLEFNKILVIDPQDKDAIANIEKTDSAIEKDKQMQVKRIQEYRENAKAYYRDGKYDSAIGELEKILVREPQDAEALKFMEELKFSKAEADEYKRLEGMVEQGKEYLKDREYDKAVQIWQQVLTEKKDFPGVEVLIAQAKFNKAKVGENVAEKKFISDREQKRLEIDKAYVPIIGAAEEETKEKAEMDGELLAIEEIKKALKEKKVTLEFTDADLRSVILFLSRQSGVNMIIDEAIFTAGAVVAGAMGAETAAPGMAAQPPGWDAPPGYRPGEAGGVPTTGMPLAPTATGAVTPTAAYNVTASLRNISLMDALSLILRPKGLDYEIYPNVVFISTRARIDYIPVETLETKI